MQNNNYITVSELNRYLFYKFEEDFSLKRVFLQGEISNFKQSGPHYYFSIKDENSEISAMLFNFERANLKFIPKDGMSVQVIGKVQVYQKRGSYAIICSQMQEIGIGLLYQNYLELKDKLAKEGLFDEKYKKPIPEYPNVVGIITAENGEAINDIVSTFNNRLPLAKLVFYPAIVQGLEAPKDLIRALDLAYQNKEIDCLIIGRGGGSFEDLNCFNDENLARKLFLAPFPTISAVGHEGDYTICDFVCSFRAPTPTGAAMKLTKVKTEVIEILSNFSLRLKKGMTKVLTDKYNEWKSLSTKHVLENFIEIIDNKYNNVKSFDERLKLLTPEIIADRLDKEISDLKRLLLVNFDKKLNDSFLNLDNYQSRLRKELLLNRINQNYDYIINFDNKLDQNINLLIDSYADRTNHLIEKMTLLNPLNIIKKGYTVVYKENNIIYNVQELKENDQIKIKFSDGSAYANVLKIEKE